MFVVACASFRLLYVVIILAHYRRKILRFDVTLHPTAGWLSRQVTEAFPWDTAPRYLLRDRDASYGQDFRKRVDAMGIPEVITAPCSPWQNAYVERMIGSIRRECLDHIMIFNERHLRRVLFSYVDYYQKHPHASFARQGLSGLSPDHDTQDRKSRRHPKSRRPASSLRTSRRLIRPRCLIANVCVPSGTPSADSLCVGRCFELDNKGRAFVVQIRADSPMGIDFNINSCCCSHFGTDGIFS